MNRANRNDQTKILETIDGIRIGKRRRRPKRLGLDTGYDSEPLRQAIRRRRVVAINDIVSRGGRWNAPSVGRTITDELTECLSAHRNLTALFSECILSSII